MYRHNSHHVACKQQTDLLAFTENQCTAMTDTKKDVKYNYSYKTNNAFGWGLDYQVMPHWHLHGSSLNNVTFKISK